LGDDRPSYSDIRGIDPLIQGMPHGDIFPEMIID
jgi:hypothetical protein